MHTLCMPFLTFASVLFLLAFFYILSHHVVVFPYALVEPHLVARAVEVMLRVLAFPVVVAAEIVPQEAHALHEGEERHGVGQVLSLHGREEARPLDVSARERLENLLVERHVAHVGVVLGGGVGR